jgi:hypothetical protein
MLLKGYLRARRYDPPMTPTPFRVQKYLAGACYPARKQEVMERARRKGADEQVLAALRLLPECEYDSPIALSRAIGRELERA